MKLGIIGGSGLYQMDEIEAGRETTIQTPYGAPSDAYYEGRLGTIEVAFLPRHGRGHRLSPSEINHRANIFGFKQLGVTQLVSISAVGSLREDFRPRDICLPDQYFDRTKQSEKHTFFGQGVVAHIAFSQPICMRLQGSVGDAAEEVISKQSAFEGLRVHRGGTYVNMEGPAFSTRAESVFYHKAGFDVIGMTSLAEAKLAREAEICYASAAMITDYDAWHDANEPVTVEMVVSNLQANIHLARTLILRLAATVQDHPDCACHHALKDSILSAPDAIPQERRKALSLLLSKYLP